MSLISSFIQNQLVKALEAEFTSHSNDIQAAFIAQIEILAKELIAWVENKIHQSPPVAPSGSIEPGITSSSTPSIT